MYLRAADLARTSREIRARTSLPTPQLPVRTEESMRFVVVETNEIPPRVFEWYAARRPGSAVAAMMAGAGGLVRTVAGDVDQAFLYPAQTWASFNTGQPYDEHGIHWYNDPKDYSSFYWLAAANAGKKCVLINTLHTSPLAEYFPHPNIACVIPDCFSPDADAYPPQYRAFQALNVELSAENGRKSSLKTTLVRSARGWLARPSFRYWGLSRRSTRQVVKLLAAALRGKPERLRCAQFPLVAQIFVDNLRRHQPDVGVLFTNHVAANMHRYWYACFPGDYPAPAYSAEWKQRYQDEILNAMDLLDEWLAVIRDWCRENDATLLVTSSMGQCANANLSTKIKNNAVGYRVADPVQFLQKLGVEGSFSVERAMVPQYTYRFETEEAAAEAAKLLTPRIPELAEQGLLLDCDLSRTKLTVTVKTGKVHKGEAWAERPDSGMQSFEIDDHHSGHHHPVGSILMDNDRGGVFTPWVGSEVDYLQYAQRLKQTLVS
jgi:hypothetical protein